MSLLTNFLTDRDIPLLGEGENITESSGHKGEVDINEIRQGTSDTITTARCLHVILMSDNLSSLLSPSFVCKVSNAPGILHRRN